MAHAFAKGGDEKKRATAVSSVKGAVFQIDYQTGSIQIPAKQPVG